MQLPCEQHIRLYSLTAPVGQVEHDAEWGPKVFMQRGSGPPADVGCLTDLLHCLDA